MEPIAIMTAFVGAVYIIARGGYIVAPAAQGNATIWLQGMGWLAVVAGVGVTAAPARFHRLADSMFLSAADPVLRTFGVLSLAFGLFLGWVAFFVL